MKKQLILVFGGLGFIGKYFVRSALAAGHEIINVDKLTYAADKIIQREFYDYNTYTFIHESLNSISHIPECDLIVNFAAESHVDNSIKSSRIFFESNVMGLHNILEHWRNLDQIIRPRFIHVSTDEVYGDSPGDEMFDEDSLLRPSNPYSASKASGDILIRSYRRTYGATDICIVRMSNNYGCRQYPEKLIPRSISRLLHGKNILIHGDGSARRSWLYVEDTIDALWTLIGTTELEPVYNISADEEYTVREVAGLILSELNLTVSRVSYGENRPGQDVRYRIDDHRIRALGWSPKTKMKDIMRRIIDTQIQYPAW